MGCCCSSRRAEVRSPVYIYCPPELEEQEPLSSAHSTSSPIPVGILVDINLRTSIPDSYRAPPTPLPYNTDSLSIGRAEGTFEGSDLSNAQEKLDCKKGTDYGIDSPKLMDDEPTKPSEPLALVTDEEDVCPICLEEYDVQNPCILTKCEHHFHLSCILEWMERSDTCPICDKITVVDHELFG